MAQPPTLSVDDIEQRLVALENALLGQTALVKQVPKASVTLMRVFSFASATFGILILVLGFLPTVYGAAFAGAAPVLLGLEKLIDLYLVDNGQTPPPHPVAAVLRSTTPAPPPYRTVTAGFAGDVELVTEAELLRLQKTLVVLDALKDRVAQEARSLAHEVTFELHHAPVPDPAPVVPMPPSPPAAS